jgi:hypothetical protein
MTTTPPKHDRLAPPEPAQRGRSLLRFLAVVAVGAQALLSLTIGW